MIQTLVTLNHEQDISEQGKIEFLSKTSDYNKLFTDLEKNDNNLEKTIIPDDLK